MKGELLHSANSAERQQSAATAPHFISLFHLKQDLTEVGKLRQNLPSDRNESKLTLSTVPKASFMLLFHVSVIRVESVEVSLSY